MRRFRSILLSGLVALLMVGMVSAADNQQVPTGNVEVNLPIGIYTGGWVDSVCVDELDGECVKIWISFDLGWIKDFLF